jgi:hypothetical protein
MRQIYYAFLLRLNPHYNFFILLQQISFDENAIENKIV